MHRLSPRTLQILGAALLVGCAIFWAISGRQNVELITAAMTLITLGGVWDAQLVAARQAHRYEIEPPPEDYEEPPERRRPRERR